jgi:hypothetical protein
MIRGSDEILDSDGILGCPKVPGMIVNTPLMVSNILEMDFEYGKVEFSFGFFYRYYQYLCFSGR